MTTQEISKRVIKPVCKDGKRHWWKAGWVCEKCGLRKADYVENRGTLRYFFTSWHSITDSNFRE
jgi:hypothetical protein